MSTASADTCKLNKRYRDCLANQDRFYMGQWQSRSTWGEHTVVGIKDRKNPRANGVSVGHRQLGCCGLHELDFQELGKAWDKYHNDKDFETLVAHYINNGVRPDDNRVCIVGLPVEVGTNSQYNIEFYNRVRDILASFGFIQVGKPYKNANSNNTIVAMVGQLP